MANQYLFGSDKNIPHTNAFNEAGGGAYTLSPKQQLAQLAATSCLNQTFYTAAQDQLELVLSLTQQLPADFVAKTALYARQYGLMKDMPAILLASLMQKDLQMLSACFDAVVNNGKMLRTFVQIIRSGALGRKSLGTRAKKLVQQWLLNATEKQLLYAAVGNQPSLGDVVKMVHPKPNEAWRAAWFAWLIGKEYNFTDLPAVTKAFELYKKDHTRPFPEVPFQMLTSLGLNTDGWIKIAQQGSWQTLRQNLNTLLRHGVMEHKNVITGLARRLQDFEEISKAKVMPYQVLSTLQALNANMPVAIVRALEEALAVSLRNVPALNGNIVLCPDVSGSMHSPVTGYRKGSTSVTRCIDIAALVTAAIFNRNSQAKIMPFAETVHQVQMRKNCSVLENAKVLANFNGGGTNCSAPLVQLNKQKAKLDMLIYISDNQSWMDTSPYFKGSSKMHEWEKLKQRNPKAKLVCIDVQPYITSQAKERRDILNIGGFSDAVFQLMALFAQDELSANHWVDVIENRPLPQ